MTRSRPPAPLALALPLLLGVALPAQAATSQVVLVGLVNNTDGSQAMTLDHHSVAKGVVTFKVANQSKDEDHEFLVVKTTLEPSKFPMTKDGARVDEKKLSGIKELGDLKPGKTGDLKLRLQPGRYVLFCNDPGHFTAGMHATLTVTG